jgi:hypothetical protein
MNWRVTPFGKKRRRTEMRASVWGLKGPLKPAGEDGTYPVLISNANSSTVNVNGALDL